MLKNLVPFLQTKTDGRFVLLLLIIYLVFPVLIFPLSGKYQQQQSGSSTPPLDLEFGFSPEKAFDYVAHYGETGRKLYAISALTIDVAYPIVYSLFFSVLILFLLKKTGLQTTKFTKLALLPFGAAISDLFENTGIVGMLLSYPEKYESLAIFTSAANVLKWALVIAAVLTIFTLLFTWLYHALKKNFS